MSDFRLLSAARDLMQPALGPDDRVLVTGAGGWFGSTALALLQGLVPAERLLAIASRPRDHAVGTVVWALQPWNDATISAFQPTIVLNFAFLTRGFAASMSSDSYAATNAALTHRFIAAASLPSVRLALTVSSGAAVTEPGHPYGRLKREEEQAALALMDPSRSIVVARAYSLSGPFVREPAQYAFSSFVAQARRGSIAVGADRPTYRRYCDVSQYLAVCLRSGGAGWSGVIESGGDLVEMGELAQRIARATGPGVTVTRVTQTSTSPSVYASDDHDWQRHCAALGFVPAGLHAQVEAAVRYAAR